MSTSRETILCVDDEAGVLNALQQQLSARFGQECDIALAQSGDDALDLIEELDREGEKVAIVIVDQIMPGMKGVDLLEKIHKRSPETNKILLTGQAGLDAVVQAINRAELNHYVAKPWDEANLRLAVETLLRNFRLTKENRRLVADLSAKNQALLQMNRELEAKIGERTSELAAANARLAQLAVTDGLTGLYNHRYFVEKLTLETERTLRSRLPLSLLMIDVDHFKQFNDKHGHPSGDQLLRDLAKVLNESRRANDIVARYGGEEFVVLLVDAGKATAVQIAERLRERVMTNLVVEGQSVTVSIGVATFPDDVISSEELVELADQALYRAKRDGRNRVAQASPIVAPMEKAL